MKPSNAVSHHAERRAEERWGIAISVDEIEAQIASGEAEVYERENPRIWKLLLKTEAGPVPIVYNYGLKTVLTVLPREELVNIREEFGCGFASKEEKAAFFSSLDSRRLRVIEARIDECRSFDPNFNIANVRRAQKIMDFVDSLPADVREIVHEHGHHIVRIFWDHSIRRANDMAILIEASRRAKSADAPGLIAFYRHFGARTGYAAHYLATVVRNEPPPKAPDANPTRLEKPNYILATTTAICCGGGRP